MRYPFHILSKTVPSNVFLFLRRAFGDGARLASGVYLVRVSAAGN